MGEQTGDAQEMPQVMDHDPSQVPMNTAIEAGPDEAKPLVLLIDHAPDVHRLLKLKLKHEELEIASAFSANEGLTKSVADKPVIILLDLDMPDMDGFDLLRRLKNTAATVQIPIIVLSGQQSPKDKAKAFDLGAVDYITKPFNLTELRVRVRSALKVCRLVAMLAQRAQIDGLTGLWNRAYFDHRWAEAVASASRHQHSLALAMIDADHFKKVNDLFGHPAGDAVLQGLARVLRRECRKDDVPCRYGGEEFTLIMPNTTTEEAAIVCERLRSTIAGLHWPNHPEHRVTISVGMVGSATATSLSPAEWIQAADINLYTSKQGGRNQVTRSDLSSPLRLSKVG
jgi:two-component system, cell cycle response regulator